MGFADDWLLRLGPRVGLSASWYILALTLPAHKRKFTQPSAKLTFEPEVKVSHNPSHFAVSSI